MPRGRKPGEKVDRIYYKQVVLFDFERHQIALDSKRLNLLVLSKSTDEKIGWNTCGYYSITIQGLIAAFEKVIALGGVQKHAINNKTKVEEGLAGLHGIHNDIVKLVENSQNLKRIFEEIHKQTTGPKTDAEESENTLESEAKEG